MTTSRVCECGDVSRKASWERGVKGPDIPQDEPSSLYLARAGETGLQTTLMAHNNAEQNHENKTGVKCDRRSAVNRKLKAPYESRSRRSARRPLLIR